MTAPSSAIKAVDVPISGALPGEVTIAFGPDNFRGCASGFTSLTDAKGMVSHLGLATFHSDHCLSLETGTIDAGIMVLTAANGDEIHATYSGWSAPPPENVGEPIAFGTTLTFSGGTGRFADATGSAEMTGSVVWQGFGVPKLPGRWEFKGTIRY